MSTEDEPTGLPELSDEAKVADLLPRDVELPAPPSKKIAERRVGGWATSARLFERRAYRPAGNSRRFWRKIEDDDPFLAKPTGRRIPEEGGHALYPQERLQRMPEPPKVTRPTEHAPPPPRPQRVAPPPAWTEEPRPAPAPTPRPAPAPRPAPRPAPAPPPVEAEAPPRVDRRPPIVPHQPGRKRPAGRMSVGPAREVPQANVRHRLTDGDGRSATEIRQEREKWREQSKGPAAPPKLRNYDDVLAILGDLKASQELHEAGVRGTTDADIVDTPPPRPKPQRVAPPPPQETAPPPRPQPPPRPTPAPQPAPPVNRSPSGRGGSGGGLDDLFGGGPNEGRMRIPRRSKGRSGEEED